MWVINSYCWSRYDICADDGDLILICYNGEKTHELQEVVSSVRAWDGGGGAVTLQASGLQCRDSSQSSLSVLFWTELQCKTMKLLSWSSTETEIFIRQWKLYSSLINVKYEREQYANEECSNSECSNAMISCYTLHVETFPFPLCENIIFSKGKYNSIVVVCTMCGS